MFKQREPLERTRNTNRERLDITNSNNEISTIEFQNSKLKYWPKNSKYALIVRDRFYTI